MSCFKLPRGLIKELETLIRKFWWGYDGNSKKVHWVKWEKLCEDKGNGGMGFKDIEKFNDSLLAKQVWRMINHPDSLCHRVFKARFFPDCSILEAKESTTGSYAWKSILSARDVIRKGMVWRIGNGSSVRIKEDKWLPDKTHRGVVSPMPTIEPGARVNTLIKAETGEWNTPEIQRLFLPHEAATICGIPLSTRLPPDRIIWGLTPSGIFTTKSAYKLLVSHASTNLAGTSSLVQQNKFWKDLWQLRVPKKIKHFAWRVCNKIGRAHV